MSYAHLDDRDGSLTKLQSFLSREVSVQLGKTFEIFQDRKHIAWGQNWKEVIEGYIDEVTFLIPIVTPGFFNSDNCRVELSQFLEREDEFGRNDLVLPIYYVDTPILNEKDRREQDQLAQAIADHQYADWRELRVASWESPIFWKAITDLAVQMRHAIDRVQDQLESATLNEDSSEENQAVELSSTVKYKTDLDTLRANWAQVMRMLKQRRRALTAAIYEEASVEGFNQDILEVSFSDENGFYRGMANDRKHAKELRATLEDLFGVRPYIKVREAKVTAERLRSQWSEIMQELKSRRQPLTVAIYEEALIRSFDGSSLEMTFPKEQIFYVEMASEGKHIEQLRKVIKEFFGSEPYISIKSEASEEENTQP